MEEKLKETHTEIVMFNKTKMVCPIINDEPFVIAKSIIDGIGLNYDHTIFSLKKNERLQTYLSEYKVMFDKFHDIPLSNLGLNFGYSYTAIPVKKVAAWLYSINANKVKEPARTVLLKFQERCDDVLFQYFFGRKELEHTYFEEKKGLLMQKRALDSRIKSLRTILFATPDGKKLSQCENDLRAVKIMLQRLEQKQFGMIYTLFDQIGNNE